MSYLYIKTKCVKFVFLYFGSIWVVVGLGCHISNSGWYSFNTFEKQSAPSDDKGFAYRHAIHGVHCGKGRQTGVCLEKGQPREMSQFFILYFYVRKLVYELAVEVEETLTNDY